jgi:hypothetical protein
MRTLLILPIAALLMATAIPIGKSWRNGFVATAEVF